MLLNQTPASVLMEKLMLVAAEANASPETMALAMADTLAWMAKRLDSQNNISLDTRLDTFTNRVRQTYSSISK